MFEQHRRVGPRATETLFGGRDIPGGFPSLRQGSVPRRPRTRRSAEIVPSLVGSLAIGA